MRIITASASTQAGAVRGIYSGSHTWGLRLVLLMQVHQQVTHHTGRVQALQSVWFCMASVRFLEWFFFFWTRVTPGLGNISQWSLLLPHVPKHSLQTHCYSTRSITSDLLACCATLIQWSDDMTLIFHLFTHFCIFLTMTLNYQNFWFQAKEQPWRRRPTWIHAQMPKISFYSLKIAHTAHSQTLNEV